MRTRNDVGNRFTKYVKRFPTSFWLAAAVALQAQAPQRPVFRGGVDLVTVDVVVLDSKGLQVSDLAADDFVVTADGRVRRLVSVEYVRASPPREKTPGVSSGGAETAVSAPPPPAASTNTAPPRGRSFLFVADVDGIRAGEGRAALAGVAAFLARLDADDRVGLVALPYGSPRVDLTVDRAAVRAAAAQVAGASMATREPTMTYGEADAIRRGDTRALFAFWERATGAGLTQSAAGERCPIPPPPISEPLRVSVDCAEAADQAVERHRRRTRTLLDSLRALADAMAPLPGPKTLVLVSEGVLNDEDTLHDVKRFAESAERARVSLYSLHLDAPLMDASGGRYSKTADSRILDDRLGFDGMAEIAASARGTAFRVIGQTTPLLDRIDHETSGYYLLSFERDATDRSRARLGIDVRVRREGLDVRARREVASDTTAATGAPARSATSPATAKPLPLPARAADRKTMMADLLEWPTAVSDVAITLATYATPARPSAGADANAEATRPLVVICADLAVDATDVAMIGYEIIGPDGRPAADTFDDPPRMRPIDAGRGQYLVAVPLAPGRHRITLGAIDRQGRRGSVSHAFEVPAWPDGLRAGDLMIGDSASGAFQPVASLSGSRARFVARVDIRTAAAATGDTAGGAFAGVAASLSIRRAGESMPDETTPVALAPGSDPGHRILAATLDASAFAPGDYVLTVTIEVPGGATIRRDRLVSVRR